MMMDDDNYDPSIPFIKSSIERKQQQQDSLQLFSLVTKQKNQKQQQQQYDDDDYYSLRNLSEKEIEILSGYCKCSCNDWSKIYYLYQPTVAVIGGDTNNNNNNNSNISNILKRTISNTTFDDTIIFVIDDDQQQQHESSTTTTNNNNNNNNDNTKNTKTTTKDWNIYNKLKIGIHSNTYISNSILHITSCRVHNNIYISNTHIQSNTIIINCGQISSTTTTTTTTLKNNNNDQEDEEEEHIVVEVGPESGGQRNLYLTPEATMIDVCNQLVVPKQQKKNKNTKSKEATNNLFCFFINILLPGSIIIGTSNIENIYLSYNTSIINATSIQNVIMLPYSNIKNSCTVTNVYIQWYTTIINYSTISNSIIMEYGYCGPNSIIHSSIIGPDVHVSNGEIHNSILGSNTNSHHQSLIIGILWPLGRGNVGYGSNVGSNHTGRIPDQELLSGEGIFWGLSSVIKLPIDLSYSPYSIIAAGTTLSPQRICMPFSLLVDDTNNTNTNNNNNNTYTGTTNTSIIPGWVLHASPYTIVRSEKKFATRRKAKHHNYYTGWKILRPEIIEMCYYARQILLKIVVVSNNNNNNNNNKNEKHTHQQQNNNNKDKDNDFELLLTKMIGSCTLTKRGHNLGIRAYTDCIQRYILHGLLQRIISIKSKTNGHFNETILLQHDELFSNIITTISRPKQQQQQQQKDKQITNSIRFSPNPTSSVQWPAFPWNVNRNNNIEWEYQQQLLLEEFPYHPSKQTFSEWVIEQLQHLITLENDFCNRIYKCKKRDDQRGAKTIPGYTTAHIPAEKDPVIIEARAVADKTEKTIRVIIEQLTHTITESKL